MHDVPAAAADGTSTTGPTGPAVVVGIDLGTTATKAVVHAADGEALGSATVAYPLHEPSPGRAEQDPAQITAAAETATRAALEQARSAPRGRGLRVAALAFSSAMHSLIGVGADGTPLTASITWADTRATDQAEALAATERGRALHRTTGTPVHAMSPLLKLVWFREQDPATAAAVRRWVGIKEHVLHAWCGQWLVDHSIASATGLLDLAALDWSPDALDVAGITADQLSRPVPVTDASSRLAPEVAERLGVDPSVPVVVGGADGPLANLGLGAVRPGVAACSIGTSGALRLTVERPVVDAEGHTFCYALGEGLWTVGGAITNGGVVLRWAEDCLAPDLLELAAQMGDSADEAMTALAAQAPPGSAGLVMLPYLLSERAPHWSSLPRGAYIGLRRSHGRAHLVRAALEGVCQQLALVLASLRGAGHEVREIRATGGFAASALWRQMLADVLGMPVSYTRGHEGSSYGAAVIGMLAVGLVDSLEDALAGIEVVEVLEPDPVAAAVYAALLPVHAGLYDALLPVFRQLRGIEPLLPTEPAG